MDFSNFLKAFIPYRNTNISLQEHFLIQLFEVSGEKFNYSEDYAKKICNGTKKITNDVKSQFTTIKVENVKKFLIDNINKLRQYEIFDNFNINKSEKLDFECLMETIAVSFKRYILAKKLTFNLDVNKIYEKIIDTKYKTNEPDANEKTLVKAKQYFLNALLSLENITPTKDLIQLQAPFTSFFNNIIEIYNVLKNQCNRMGRFLINNRIIDLLSKSKNDLFNTLVKEDIDEFNLKKKIQLSIYDNVYNFSEYKVFEFDLYEDENTYKLTDNLNINYPLREIFFSEEIVFQINDLENNILEDIFYICNQTKLFLNELEKDFIILPAISKLNLLIDDAHYNSSSLEIKFYNDGHKDTVTNEIFYSENIDIFFKDDKGLQRKCGDDFIALSKLYETTDVYTAFEIFCARQFNLYINSNGGDLMVDFQLITEEKNVRWFYIPPASKSTIYRRLKQFKSMVKTDKIIGFFAQFIMVINSEEHLNAPIEERIKTGKDAMICFGYYEGKQCTRLLRKSDILSNKIKISEEPIYLNAFDGLMNEIDEFVK